MLTIFIKAYCVDVVVDVKPIYLNKRCLFQNKIYYLGAVYMRKIVPPRWDVSPKWDEYHPGFTWEIIFQRTRPTPPSLYAEALIRRRIFYREIYLCGKVYKNGAT